MKTLTFNFDERATESISGLKKTLGLKTNEEVITRALTVLHLLVDHESFGGTINLVEKNNVDTLSVFNLSGE
jgi:hypothetical protein